MAVRVTVALVSDKYQQVTVEDATSFKTNATGGAGLIADLFDDESNTIATFGHVLYVETVDGEKPPLDTSPPGVYYLDAEGAAPITETRAHELGNSILRCHENVHTVLVYYRPSEGTFATTFVTTLKPTGIIPSRGESAKYGPDNPQYINGG